MEVDPKAVKDEEENYGNVKVRRRPNLELNLKSVLEVQDYNLYTGDVPTVKTIQALHSLTRRPGLHAP